MKVRHVGLVVSLFLLPIACDAPLQPTANAGSAQMVAVRQLVQLDGSASMSRVTTAGAMLSRYQWAFTSVPSGSTAIINQPDIAKPSFTPDLVGDYVVGLTVYDANGSASASVTITAVACMPMLSPITAAPAAPNVGDDVTLSTMVTKGTDCDDRSPYTYAWSIVSRPVASNAVLSPASTGGGSNAITPSFHVDVAGTYDFTVRVTDSAGRWLDATATVIAGNCGDNAPSVQMIVATPAMPNTGDVVELSANVTDADTDPAGMCKLTQAVSYQWTLLAPPVGATATLSATDSATPWLRPDVNGSYTIRLVVTDSTGLSSPANDFVLAVADCGSKLPVIGAITPSTQTPYLGQQISLGASVSDDNTLMPCNKIETFSYAWTLIAQPAQSIAKLMGPNTATPTFVADQPGNYQVQLTVTDSDHHVSAPLQSAMIVAGSCGLSPPVAQVGILSPLVVAAPAAAPPKIALQTPIGVPLQLDASTSSDPDNAMMCMLPNPQTLSYTWRVEMLPPGSKAALNDLHATTPSLTPDVPGAYVIDLVVTDNTGLSSAPARVEVSGFDPNPTVAFGVGPYTALALDGTDPRIAFYDQNRGGAFVATCTGANCQTNPVWSISSVELGGALGRQISIAAGTGNIYVAYWDAGNCLARYAVSKDLGKTWAVSTIPLPGNGSACVTNTSYTRPMCFKGQGNQQNEINPSDNGSFPSIALSAMGDPIVTVVNYVQGPTLQDACGNNYVSYGYNDVRMATCTGASCLTNNPTWNVSVAGVGATTFNARVGYTSLAFDPSTKLPAIAFRTNNLANNNGNDAVGFVACTAGCATQNPTYSQVAWVDVNRGFGAFSDGQGAGAENTTSSLAISSTGQPSIAYFDANNEWLRFTTCAKGGCANAANWNGTVIDSTGDVGEYAALALSPLQATLDRPRIAYLNNSGGTTRYAQQAGDGTWSWIDVDGGSGYIGLKLSAGDGPRMSYWNTNAVRYFTSGN